jgi:hypothetical protein
LQNLHRLDHPRRELLYLKLAMFKAEGESHDDRANSYELVLSFVIRHLSLVISH